MFKYKWISRSPDIATLSLSFLSHPPSAPSLLPSLLPASQSPALPPSHSSLTHPLPFYTFLPCTPSHSPPAHLFNPSPALPLLSFLLCPPPHLPFYNFFPPSPALPLLSFLLCPPLTRPPPISYLFRHVKLYFLYLTHFLVPFSLSFFHISPPPLLPLATSPFQ
jgi:hypothetical protein